MNENFNTEPHRDGVFEAKKHLNIDKKRYAVPKVFYLLALCFGVCAISFSCKKAPTDMRTLAPNDTIVYLETANLGAMLQSLTENKAWENLAQTKTDFSPLENIQAAVVVTSFESSEKQVTGESFVLNFKPQFALIADTHQWESTAVSVAENQIGKFVRQNYGDAAKLEKSDKGAAKFFVWTSADNQKFYAAVTGSVIYTGNNENLLDKCLAVKNGAADSLSKNENLTQARENFGVENQLAFGYISAEGVAQLSNLIGISTAIEVSEEDLPRSLIAKILPEIMRKTAREIVWMSQKDEQGITDKIFVKIEPEVATIFKETLQSKTPNQLPEAEYLPIQFDSITRYNLQNPQIAWRSVLLVALKQTDAPSAQILLRFSGAFFENYGIADSETFLNQIDSPVITARFDEDGEKSVMIATVKDAEKLKQSITKEINFKASPEKIGAANIWKSSEDDDLAAAFAENLLILGEKQSVIDCLNAKTSGQNFAQTVQFQSSKQNSATAVSVAKDTETAQKIVRLLGNAKEENKQYASFYTTQTNFSNGIIERRTISDFGLIGEILEKFSDSEK